MATAGALFMYLADEIGEQARLTQVEVRRSRCIIMPSCRTMAKADFYGQCASYSGLRAAIADHQSLIGPLSEEELRVAIESPAQLAGGNLA